MSTANVVALVLVGLVFLALLAIALLPKLIAPLMADSFGEVNISIQNECASDIRLRADGDKGLTASTSYDLGIGPGVEGELYADPQRVVVSAPGGPWSRLEVDSNGSATVTGDTCPSRVDPASAALVALRAPLLDEAKVESARLDPGSSHPFANPKSEITTLTAVITPEVAETWTSLYELEPVSAVDAGIQSDLDVAAPGARWVSSIAFRQAMPAEPLAARAYLDPATGTVVVQLWEIDFSS